MAQLCGTHLEDASFSLAHLADLLLRFESLFSPILFFFHSSSLLPSCHFGIISLSCKGKGVKYPKISKAISRLAVLPLALCISIEVGDYQVHKTGKSVEKLRDT